MLGYFYFGERYLDVTPYLDGQSWVYNCLPEGIGWQAQDDDFIHVIPTMAGTDALQKIFTDTEAADLPLHWRFSMQLQGVDSDEHFRLHRALGRGAAVYFVPGIWVEEVFTNMTNGETRALSRPLAEDIHPDVTSVTHPYQVYKDDVLDGTAASISGTPLQVVTAAADGDIAIRYMPAFRVIAAGISENVPTQNGLVTIIQLREVVNRP